MNKDQAIKTINEKEELMSAYRHAMGVLHWDGATFAPPMSAKGRGKTLSILSAQTYKLMTGKEMVEALDTLNGCLDDLDFVTKRRVEELSISLKETQCIPMDRMMEMSKLRAMADGIWSKAKDENDFASFAPTLEKMMEMAEEFALYKNPDQVPYETMLDDFDRGSSMAQLDEFFAAVKKVVVPLNKMVAESPVNEKVKDIEARLQGMTYDVHKQRVLSKKLYTMLGLPESKFSMSTSAHPFTTGYNSGDTRFTTRFSEDYLMSNVFATMHESGHAIHGMNADPALDGLGVRRGHSASMAESQSRFYENIIGRSEVFMPTLHKTIGEVFPEFTDKLSVEDLYLYSNRSAPSLIRIEADELTYSLHIMVRYEIERMMFTGDLKVKDLPAAWNELIEKYLGIVPPNDTMGVLQDTHWAMGLVGYFPSYALGSAFSSQFSDTIAKKMDFKGLVASNNLVPITDFLKENVHWGGGLYSADEILVKATGESFDPKYYTNYLSEKYTKIYG